MTPLSKGLAPLANESTKLLKALAHPERLIICCQLRDTEMSVGDIETTLGIKQPRLSRELSKLRDTGLVETRKESKLVFYTLSDKPRVREMVDAICAVMLGETAPNSAGATASPKLKPNRPGGYGVFARTGT
jgi:ArsR family transcriptional regulator, virulence genes transcriptional regulator